MPQSDLRKELHQEALRIEKAMRNLRSRYDPDDPDDPRVRLRQELAIVHQQMQDAGCFRAPEPVGKLAALVTEGTLRIWTSSDRAPGPYEVGIGPGRELQLFINFVKWYASGPWTATLLSFVFRTAGFTFSQTRGAGRFDLATKQLDLHSEIHVDGPFSDFGLDFSSSGSITPPNTSPLQGTTVGPDNQCVLVGSTDTKAYGVATVTLFAQLTATLSGVPS